MTALRALGACVLLFLGLACGAFAQTVERRPDILGVIDRDVLRVAVPAFDSPPFFYTVDGELQGLDIELAKGIGVELNVDVEFDRSAKTFNEVVEIVTLGQADIAICKLSRTLHRARYVRYTLPYVVFKHALALNRIEFAELAHGREAEEVIRNFEGTIGVIAQSSFADFARRNFPKAEIVELPSWADVVAAVRNGVVVAAYRDEFEIKKITIDDPSASLLLRTVTLSDLTDTLGMAVPADSPNLAAFLDMYIADRLGILSTDKVLDRYEQLVAGAAAQVAAGK
jgi:polar amino acid transport system substrate-binding protein